MAVLSKTLKCDLVNKVLLDQYSADTELLKSKLKKHYKSLIIEQDAGLTEKLKTALITAGVDPVNERWMNTCNVMSLSTRGRRSLKSGGTLGVTESCLESVNSWEKEILLSFSVESLYTEVSLALCLTKNTFLTEVTPTITMLFGKAQELFVVIQETKKNLEAVTASVKTVKQLQSITKVFDPFLPTVTGGMGLLPAEALCAVNLLKTPKVVKAGSTA